VGCGGRSVRGSGLEGGMVFWDAALCVWAVEERKVFERGVYFF